MVLSNALQQAEGPLYLIYIALAILGMVGAGAGILAYIRGNLAKGTIELLQTANTTLNSEVAGLKTERAELRTQIEKLRGKVEVLEGLVTQTKSIDKLNGDEAARHIEQMGAFQNLTTAVRALPQSAPRRPRRVTSND